MKRFIICIVNCAFCWFSIGYILSFVFVDKIFSLIDIPLISDEHLKLILILGTIIYFLITLTRTDLLLGEINYSLNPYKVIYYLMKDLKELHKLNEKNYKKLAILSRSIQLLFMDCGTILLVIAATLPLIKIATLSAKMYLLWGNIIFILITATTATSSVCLAIIMLSYYTMILQSDY